MRRSRRRLKVRMDVWLQPPINMCMAVVLAGMALAALVLCVRRFGCACRQTGDLTAAQWLLRAMRWLSIGLVILSQELYEGFILGAALRTGRRVEKGPTPFG